jgi:hypothetical protein
MVSMNHEDERPSTRPAGRKVKLTQDDLKLISESQKLSGFSGEIFKELEEYEVDMDEVSVSASHLGAQIPSPEKRRRRPLLRNWKAKTASD